MKASFLEHLDELRTRIITCLIVVCLVSVGAYFFSDELLTVLMRPLTRFHYSAYFFSPYEAFWVKLTVSFFAGIIISVPALSWHLWRFIAPGLYKKEQRLFLPNVIGMSALFLCGAAFCYFIMLPFTLRFLLSFGNDYLRPLISIKEYMAFVTLFIVTFGVLFNLPLLSIALTRMNIVTHTLLRKKRRHVVVAIFIIAAIITPPDVFTQLMLAGPLLLLYEASILCSWIVRRERRG